MGLPEKGKITLPHKFKKGKNNLITDVPGVTVGQVTLIDDENTYIPELRQFCLIREMYSEKRLQQAPV